MYVLATSEFSVETKYVFCVSTGCIFSVLLVIVALSCLFAVFGVCLNRCYNVEAYK